MIHAICDFCGKDIEDSAVFLSMTPFQNYARNHSDTEPFGFVDRKISFVMCSECLQKHSLPNPYGNYRSITEQEVIYHKCLDNYTKMDWKNDSPNQTEVSDNGFKNRFARK